MDPGNREDWREGARAEYAARRSELEQQRQALARKVAQLNDRLRELTDEIGHLDLAAKVFGLPIMTGEPLAPPADRASFRETALPKGEGLFKEEALVVAKETYPDPVKAAQLQAEVERRLGRVFHQKTAGMTLYRLSKDGLVRREGHNWFFVPSEMASAQAEENPDGVPSGLFPSDSTSDAATSEAPETVGGT
jgi:hypothetical protein